MSTLQDTTESKEPKLEDDKESAGADVIALSIDHASVPEENSQSGDVPTEVDVREDNSRLESLMQLRSLLTPAGFGESAATAAAAAAAKGIKAPVQEGPDWTT